jgi:hypothetical protein
MNILRLLCFAFVLCITGIHCTDRIVDPPVDEERIKLTLFDVSVHEAFIHVALDNETAGGAVHVYRDNEQISVYASSVTDTILYDSALRENTTYTYRAEIRRGTAITVRSNEITVQTLLPSSHDFEWQTVTIGEHSTSLIRDVVIIDQSNIWAVGELFLNDSSGQIDPRRYNAVYWNSDKQKWELKRVSVVFRGNMIIPPLYGIYAFSGTDIWFAAGLAIHGNGTDWVGYDVRAITGYDTLSFTKCWGQNSSDMYFVGLLGSLAHFSNGTWQRVESGISTDIIDVWGDINPLTGNGEVYCAYTDFFKYSEKGILKIIDTYVAEMIPWENEGGIASVWTQNGFPLYTAGDGVYALKRGYWEESDIGRGVFTTAIRGNGLNDIFVSGHFGTIAHYNGIDWHVYPEVYNALYTSIAVNNNIVVAVGTRDGKGVITVGRRV